MTNVGLGSIRPDSFAVRLAGLRRQLALIAVVVAAAALRLHSLGDDPVAMNQDEAVNGYDAYCLGLTLRDHHGHFLPIMFESFEDWASPLLTYLTTPFVRIFGLSLWVVRLPVALLGTAAVPLVYALVRKLCGRQDAALLAAMILATAPWSITLSRWAVPPSIVPFFLILFALVLLWAADTENGQQAMHWRAALAAVAAAAVTYAYPSEKLFGPLMIATASIVFFRRKWTVATVLVLIYLALVAPIFLLTLRDPTTYNARFAQIALHGSALHKIAGFVLRYFLYLSPISFFGSGDTNIRQHVPFFGSNFAFLAPFFYLGVVSTIAAALAKTSITRRTNGLRIPRSHAVFLLAWLALFPVPGSLTTHYMHVLRGVQGLPLVPIFAALGVVRLAQARARFSKLKWALYATITGLTLSTTLDFVVYYLTGYRNISKVQYQFGLREVFTYVLPREADFRSIVVDDAIIQPYIYVLFYSKRDPRSLNYSEINADSSQSTVRHLGQFRFEPVSSERVARARLIYRVRVAGSTWYSVYENADHVCLIKQASGLSAN